MRPAVHEENPREPGPASWIAKERLEPGEASMQWVLAAFGGGLITMLVSAYAAWRLGPQNAAESAYLATDGFLQALLVWMDPVPARLVSAVAHGALVVSTAFVARRLMHQEGLALAAAALVAIDPMNITYGRLALPVMIAAASGMIGLAMFLDPRPKLHWWGTAFLGFAAFLSPSFLLWAAPVAMLVLLRGHIYAAPRHAITALVQGVAVPGFAALFGVIGASSTAICHTASRGDALLLQHVSQGGLAPIANPVTWFAGILGILYLGGLAGNFVIRNFRLQRLPGRIQVRIGEGLPRNHGRILWLLALAILAPTPIIMAGLFAIAAVATTEELGRDSRAFGMAMLFALILLAAAYSVQFFLFDLATFSTPTSC